MTIQTYILGVCVMIKNDISEDRLKYLKLLSKQFPTIRDASREIINLEAITNLPKGTEHFLSDIHGEDEAFSHILKNGSGVIRKKIEDSLGGRLTDAEKQHLATLIYYPKEVLALQADESKNNTAWYQNTLENLVLVCRSVSSKYTRSKVRKALPQGFEYILEELLHEQDKEENKQAYYDQIIHTIVEIGQGDPFIKAICHTIQRFSVDHLHIIGDVFDRGAGVHIIMERLMNYHSVDFQWGNHDMLWMGAYTGSLSCIASVVRISLRYGNHELLDEDYGINLLPLAKFAMATYDQVEDVFMPMEQNLLDIQDTKMISQMHKAISIILFKLEGQVIQRNKSYDMDDRMLLNFIDYEKNTIILNHKIYDLNWLGSPTIDPNDPYALTEDEWDVINKLRASFTSNEKLGKHVDFLFDKGSIYLRYNNNLLYHGCIPTDDDGVFTAVKVNGKYYSGKALLDKYERMVRRTYSNRFNITDQQKMDVFYYLWQGPNSSLFGKNTMKTFERLFVEDKSTHNEDRNSYYTYNISPEYCDKIFQEFGMDKATARIVNGHVPVKVGKGESPVKADGKMIIIDGGLSKAYQKVTDIAGYTLIYNSHGLLLAEHQPFVSAKTAIEEDIDLISEVQIVYNPKERIRVSETDIGKRLMEDIDDLKDLLLMYQDGLI